MLKELDTFYFEQPEPNRSFMLGLQQYILDYSPLFTAEWKYKLPFFYYKEKPFCYIWKDKKTNQPYLGIVKAGLIEHPLLIQGNRKKMKILTLDVNRDIPIEIIDGIFKMLIKLY